MATTKISQHVIGSGAITASHVSNITTANITENTNLYHTSARARGAISVTGGYLSYDSGTGVIQLTFSTPASNSNDTTPATTAYVTSAIGAINSFTGTIGSSSTATTQSSSDNSTKLATTAFVGTAITNVIGGAPGTLDTLNELAAAINDDSSYATTLTTALATKAAISGQTFTGNITAPNLIASTSVYSNNGVYYGATTLNLKDSSSASFLSFASNKTATFAGNIEASGTRTIAAQFDSQNYMQIESNNSGGVLKGLASNVTGLMLRSYGDSFFVNNVGIGTTSPQHKFDTVGTIRSTHNVVSNTVYKAFSIGSNRTINDYGGLNKDYWAIQLATPGPNTDGQSSGHAYGALKFSGVSTSDTTLDDVLVLNYNGNVGIGTASPDYALDVYDVGEAWIRADSSTTTESTANSGLRFAHGGVNHGVLYHRGSDDALLYFDNIAASTRFLIDSSGNVGIGTDTPPSPLSIFGTGTSSPQSSTAQQSYDNALFRINNFANSSVGLSIGSAGSNVTYIQTSYNEGTTSPLTLNPFGGNVGIGESSPDRTFHVKSGTTNVVAKFESTDGIAAIEFTDPNGSAEIGNDGNDVVLFPAGAEKFRVNTSGNIVAQSATQNRIVLGSTGNSSNNTSNWVRGNQGYLQFNSASSGYNWEIAGANRMTMDSAGVLTLTAAEFRVNNSAVYPLRAAGSGTVMRGAAVHHMITHDHRTPLRCSAPHGHMSFGFTSYALNNSSPWADILYLQSYTDASGGSPNALVVSRSGSNAKIVRYPWSNTSTTAISGGTQYGLDSASASDERLKENVNNITNGLSVINQLRPVTFNWNDDYIESGSSKNAEELEVKSDTDQSIKMPSSKVENVGLIAQEVETVVPTVVHEGQISIGGVDYKNVDYKKLVPHLIAALQEADNKIDALTTRIEALEG